MKKQFTVLLLLIFLISCDDKLDALDSLNTLPEVEFFSRSTSTWVPVFGTIIDSAKVHTEENNINYSIVLRARDANNNFESIRIDETEIGGEFFLDNMPFTESTTVELDSFSLAYRFFAEDTRNFTIRSKDDFGALGITQFSVNFLDNKIPIANLQNIIVNDISINEYMIDGSLSFDRDQLIGGAILEYEFTIDGQVINTSSSSILHVFSSGEHQVFLRVKDNDGIWSTQVGISFTI